MAGRQRSARIRQAGLCEWSPGIRLGIALGMAGLAGLASGCGLDVDPGEARLCRAALAALHPGARISVDRVRSVAGPAIGSRAGTTGVSITYSTTDATTGGEASSDKAASGSTGHRLTCHFDPARGATIAPHHMVAAETEAGQLAPARLYMLRRFWLETAEGAMADPEPVAGAGRVREVPRHAAIALQALVAGAPGLALAALLAGAYALIYGLVGRANLAFGDLAVLDGYGALLGVAATGPQAGQAATVLAALLLGTWTAASLAAVLGRHVFVRWTRVAGQAPLVASAALALVLAEGVRLAQGSTSRAAPAVLNTPLAVARAGDFVVTVTAMGLVVTAAGMAATLVLLAVMRRTRFARRWRAVADDPGAAALAGIDPGRLFLATFGLAGALAGLAGAIATLSLGGVSHGTGLLIGLKAVLAAILGGAGSVSGAVAAAVLIGGIEVTWSAVAPIEHRDAVVLALLALALVLRPGGFHGRPELEQH